MAFCWWQWQYQQKFGLSIYWKLFQQQWLCWHQGKSSSISDCVPAALYWRRARCTFCFVENCQTHKMQHKALWCRHSFVASVLLSLLCFWSSKPNFIVILVLQCSLDWKYKYCGKCFPGCIHRIRCCDFKFVTRPRLGGRENFGQLRKVSPATVCHKIMQSAGGGRAWGQHWPRGRSARWCTLMNRVSAAAAVSAAICLFNS